VRAIDISFFVILGSWVLFATIWGFHEFSIWIYFLLALVPSLIRYVIEPVRISEEKNWYTIMIRNEKYAREFAAQNNLNKQLGV